MIEKTIVLVICIHERVLGVSINFRVKSGLAILKF